MLEEISSAQKIPKAIIYPATSSLGTYFCDQLTSCCQIFALAEQFSEDILFLFGRKNFSFLYFADFLAQPPAEIDYIFEIGSQAKLLGTANKYRAKYLAVLDREDGGLLSKIKKLRTDGRLVLPHQLFGPRLTLGNDFISQTLAAAVEGTVMRVPGNGLSRLYPLFAGDLAQAAAKAMFSPGTAGKTFALCGEPITCFSFVHLVKKVAQKEALKIEFVAAEVLPKIEAIEPAGEKINQGLAWQPTANLEKELGRTLGWLEEKKVGIRQKGAEEKEKPETEENQEIEEVPAAEITETPQMRETPETREVRQTPVAPEAPVRLRSAKKCLLAFLLGLFWLAILANLPLGLAAFNAYRGTRAILAAAGNLNAGELTLFDQYASRAKTDFTKAREILAWEEWFWEKIGLSNAFFVLDDWLSLGEHLSRAAVDVSQSITASRQFGAALLSSEKPDLESFLRNQNLLLEQAMAEVNLSQTLLDEERLPTKLLFLNLEKFISETKFFLPKGKSLLYLTKEGMTLLPSLLAKDSRKTYLLLLQNNMELRPTGGFIGSFGLLTFADGRFLDFGVLDVYAADGQLRGHVEPPPQLKEYLGEAGWYLRDSNWDPDFPTSARRAAWFLEKEMGRTVDGVLAINLNLAKNLLGALSEAYLPDYQEKITAANLFERAEYHAEVGTFPGSSQKSDFLGALSNALFERIKIAGEKEFFGIARGVYQSLEAGDLALYLNDQSAEEVIQKLGWAGEIGGNVKCQMSNVKCYEDYLMLVEANLGVNKANYFLNRKIDQKIELSSEGKVVHRLTILYQNTAATEAWPAGKYKNYLRIYAPPDALLQEFKIEGKEAKVEIAREHEKSVFGSLVEVPIGEKRTVKITYELAETVPEGQRVSYLFFRQRQSGSSQSQNSLLFSFPPDWKPLLISPAGVYSPGSLLFSDFLEKSRTYRIEFVR
jgi:hypothetical protein